MKKLDNGLMKDSGCWPPRAAQEQRLLAIEALLALKPDAVDAQIERAMLLNALDRRVDAQQVFVEILLRAPTHFSALNEFGNLLSAMGFVAAACRVYAEAIKHHPKNATAHVNLANLLLRGNKLEKARVHYEAALRLDPNHPQAHQGLGATLAANGIRGDALFHSRAGFRNHSIMTLPYRGTKPPVPLLLLVSSGDGNIPTTSFLDDRIFLTTVIVADFLNPSLLVPPHRLVFNAIGDADLCKPALEAAICLTRRSNAPIINDPTAVLETGRAENAKRLGGLPGVRTPRMLPMPRRMLGGARARAALSSRGFTYPLLLRSPGFHTGRHFVLVNEATELPTAVDSLPGEELLAIEYLDARGGDGNARKYRAMIVDGRIYPLHLAISRHWKVHYFTSDMADSSAHRAEDAAFIENMPAVIGCKAMTALERIRDVLGLDYGGIDFGLSPAGDVLLFEANATMVVNPPDTGERWAYRRPAVTRILDAVNAMIVRVAANPKTKMAS